MRRFIVLAAAVIVLGVGTPSARAVLLSDLLVPGATFTNGDKVFSNFTYASTGDMPAATAVNVVATTDIFGNLGFRLQGTFIDAPGGSGSDASLSYDVASTGTLITDVHLIGNPSVSGGTGVFNVTETVHPLIPPAPPTTLGQLTIFANNPGTSQLDDVLVLDKGYRKLHIDKDISALSGTGVASASIIDQTFSQAVPEPTTLSGAGLAVFFSLACAWRRRRAKAA